MTKTDRDGAAMHLGGHTKNLAQRSPTSLLLLLCLHFFNPYSQAEIRDQSPFVRYDLCLFLCRFLQHLAPVIAANIAHLIADMMKMQSYPQLTPCRGPHRPLATGIRTCALPNVDRQGELLATQSHNLGQRRLTCWASTHTHRRRAWNTIVFVTTPTAEKQATLARPTATT